MKRGIPLLLVCVAAGCEGESSSKPEVAEASRITWLQNQQAESGIDFLHVTGHDGVHLLPEAVGSGVGVVDLDEDGLLDVVMIQTLPGSGTRVYRNLGEGRFESMMSLGAEDTIGMGVATGDYDGDGDLDLYLTNLGRNLLYRNDGGGTLTDVTAAAGVGEPGFGAAATFFDADGDPHPDLVVVNYVDWTPELERACRNAQGDPDYCAPTDYGRPTVDVLYRNNGDGTFTDVTAASGLPSAPGTGLGVIASDFDGDGREDLFVANDTMPDRLWHNLGNFQFEDVALVQGCAVDNSGTAKAGMGVTAADIDFDGDLDLMVCNLSGETDSVYRNEGTHFRDITANSGLAVVPRGFTRFGLGWVDMNNDGLLDLFQANGRVGQMPRRYSEDPYAEPDLLLRGLPNGRFETVETSWAAATGRGAAFADLDNDGGLDVVVNNRDAVPHVLMNVHPDRGHWLLLDVREAAGGPALGATVTMRVGDRAIRRDVRTGWSYLSANDPRVHVGLGDIDLAREVTVTWPDGTRLSLGDLDVDRIHLVRPPVDQSEAGAGDAAD
ncbi:MAG: CRTAC1 family protein [Phycisphaerales bacterium]|nr:CRTAC1 family protein [Phycisphaerales bacterium]